MAGVVTRLVYQKNKRQRVNVYIDDVFEIALPDIVAAELKIGQYLSEEEIVHLRQRDSESKAYDRALRLLSHRPRSQHEIESYLKRAEFTPMTRTAVIARLNQLGYIDDHAFVQWWLENRSQFSPRGQRALRQELLQKGIDHQLIDEALIPLDESALALAAGLTRASRWSHFTKQDFQKKMLGYLQRRGFSYSTARHTTEQLWNRFGSEDTDSEHLS